MAVSNSTDRFNGYLASLAQKAPCAVATDADITLSGEQTVAGVAVVSGDRVLVKDQTDAVENGIWVVRSSGWERAPDWDGNRDVAEGTLAYAHDSAGELFSYVVTTADPIKVGITAVTIEVYASGGTGGGLPDGTAEGQTAYWDDTAGEWVANNLVKIGAADGLTINDINEVYGFSIENNAGGWGTITANAAMQAIGAGLYLYDFFEFGFYVEPGTTSNPEPTYTDTPWMQIPWYGDGDLYLATIGFRGTGQFLVENDLEDGSILLNVDTSAFGHTTGIEINPLTGVHLHDLVGTDSIALSTIEYGIYSPLGSVYLEEKVAADADTAERGQFWVRNDNPQTPMFTDGDGTDIELNASGGGNMNDGDPETVTALHNYTVGNTPPGAGSALTADMLFIDAKEAIDGNDTFLRLNNNGDFASGVFLNTTLRIDAAGGLDIRDSGGVDSITFIADGTDLNINGNSTAANLDVVGFTGDLRLHGGVGLIIDSVGAAGQVAFNNDGTTLSIVGTSMVDIAISGITEMSFADAIISGATLKDYSIEQVDYVPSGTSQALVYADGPVFTVDLESASGAMTLSITGGPSSGNYGQVTVRVQQDGASALTVTWGGGDTYRHANGSAHPMNTTLDGVTIYTLETFDAGASWEVAGVDYS